MRGIPGTLVVEVWFARKPNTVKLLADVVYSKKVQHVQDWRTDALTLHLWGIDSCMPFRSTNAKVDPVRRASSEKPSTRIEIDIGGICGDLGPAFLKDLLVHSKSPLKTIALWTNAFLNRCVSGHYAKFVSRDQYLGYTPFLDDDVYVIPLSGRAGSDEGLRTQRIEKVRLDLESEVPLGEITVVGTVRGGAICDQVTYCKVD